MNALLDALARWGPATVAAGVAVVALLLVLAGFGIGLAHGSASAPAFAGAAGIVVLLGATALQALRQRDI